MADIMLNLDFSGPSPGRKKNTGSSMKHKRFVRRRHYLEKRGFLNKKQNVNNSKGGESEGSKRLSQHKGKCSPQSGAVFSKVTTSHLDLSSETSNSVQAHTGKSVSELGKRSTVLSSSASQEGSTSALHKAVMTPGNPMKYIAIDCEMVGTGPKGHCSELARCSIVSYEGDVIYDKFIKPVNPVTDLRTRWSGVRWQDLRKATPFTQAQKEILKILCGKVVVGHAVQNDFKVLHYAHPACLTRDTSHIPILNKKAGLPENKPCSLKSLTKSIFNKDIQVGKKGHSSVEDARATMELYKIVEHEWEAELASKASS